MIDFHPVTLADKSWIDPLVWAEGSSSADFNFGNIYLWDKSFHQQVAKLNDRVLVMPCYEDTPFFAWPVGTGELPPVMAELAQYAKGQGFPMTLRGVTAEHLPLVEALFAGRYTLESERPLWDYLYSAEKLDTLAGKALHGKRNHINRFTAENNWRFSAMTPEDFPACLALLDDWITASGQDADSGVEDEHTAIRRAFESFEPLGMEGGVLWVDDKPVAFTLGECVCRHTFVVHFEKAYADINGAFTMVNREFVRQIRQRHPAIEWINREDDMGLDSLRQAKQSYHPDRMVEKYTVVVQHD
jgi:hypothetical protein